RRAEIDSATIRERFITFFEEKGHHLLPSAPLVLKDDPSVFFTSAGMQPLVPYFLGKKQPPSKRIVTIQKVFRTSDIDEVGNDSWHQTFWEMLGNFGIGDYWKKDAISWGWELLIDRFGFDPAKLVATVYKTDDEAFDIWTKELRLLPAEKVYRLGDLEKGDETNFWSPGPTGLCGPCSEVFVDRGPQPGVREHDCSPAENCGRWIEIWNFVFQQYDRQPDGILAALGTEVVKHMQQHYPELTRARDRIPQILGDEEAKFERTLENGLEQLTAAIESAKGAGYARIDGDTAFRLFDTFGFPLEM